MLAANEPTKYVLGENLLTCRFIDRCSARPMRVRWLSRSATVERLVCLACVVCLVCLVCLLGLLSGEGVGLAPELPLLEVGLG